MKVVYTILATIIFLIFGLFIAQNWTVVEVYFLTYETRLSVSILSLFIYILGAISGTFVIRVLRKSLNPVKSEKQTD